jgi:hypothetical protein
MREPHLPNGNAAPASPAWRLAAAALGIALTLGQLDAAAAGQARIPMSDAEVRAMGEDPASGDFFRLPHDPALDNADRAQPKQILATRYTSIAGSEFRPRSSAAKFIVPTHARLLCQVDSTNSVAEAQLFLPDGAEFQFVRIYAEDANENDLNVALVERCQPTAAGGNVTSTVLGSVITSGTPGRVTLSTSIAGAATVDNLQCSYALRAQLNSVVTGCAPALSLDKVRVQWIE